MKKNLILLLAFLLSINSFAQENKKPTLKIGGALRFNYNLSSWKPGQKARGGDFGFDVFRINAKAEHKGIKLNAEYRLYSSGFGGGMLKQGWVAYAFNPKNEIQVGLTQVPFGITQHNSHSWFFSLNYYLGLEDDHDMGIKFQHRGDDWDYDIAFFKNAEELKFGSYSDVSNSRYSYDVSSIELDGDGNLDLRNKEVNQINGKIIRKFGCEKLKHKIGASGQYGGLYNLETKETGQHYAFAFHYELKAELFDLKLQAINYNLNAKNPSGQPNNVIAMTAYGFPYLISAKGNLYTVGVGYSIPVNWLPISNLQFYNDFGVLDKSTTGFKNSFMNVTGVLITAGNVYTYLDFAAGKNHPWLGSVWTNALANGTPNEKWEMRFNINMGYYF
ncbi:MAG: hypothetical protein V3V16_11570 [Melioribacteraceae bacterium]